MIREVFMLSEKDYDIVKRQLGQALEVPRELFVMVK